MRQVVGIGEIVLDIVIKDGKPLAAVPGGSTFNSMISLGRTAGKTLDDVSVKMLTQVGDDYVADLVLSFMKSNNVGAEYVRIMEKVQSNISLALLDEKNNAHYEFFRDASAPVFKAAGDISFSKGDIVLFGSSFAVNPSTREQAREIIRKAHDAGAIVYYDINFRKSRIMELSEQKAIIEENCRLSDIVRGSSEDLESLYGTSDAAYVYDNLMSPLCGNFICTKGAKSTEVFSPSSRCSFDVDKLDSVVSTIGAGDNFNAGFVFGLLRDGILSADNLEWNALVPTAHRFSANVCRSLFNYVDESFLA